MEETVTKYSGDKFSLYLEIMEAKEKQAEMDRQLQEEKYLRRTQRIYEYHERQQREALQLRECLEFVTSHAGVLESALRGSNGSDAVPLSAALVGLVAPLQRCMQQCVANATTIRRALAGRHQNQMDAMLQKMERELRVWTEFLQRALDSTATTETLIDNLHNIIAEQRRCVSEISSSGAFRSLDASPTDTPATASPPAHACSTPINRD